jgi:hypothetical protein
MTVDEMKPIAARRFPVRFLLFISLSGVMLASGVALPDDGFVIEAEPEVEAEAKDLVPLRGRIITSDTYIDIPPTVTRLVDGLNRQDKDSIPRNENGRWTVHFVAFFKQPLSTDHAAVVVLDAQENAVAVAKLPVYRGQTNLSSQVEVESSASPGKGHTLQIYYAKKGKPVVLLKKTIVLR